MLSELRAASYLQACRPPSNGGKALTLQRSTCYLYAHLLPPAVLELPLSAPCRRHHGLWCPGIREALPYQCNIAPAHYKVMLAIHSCGREHHASSAAVLRHCSTHTQGCVQASSLVGNNATGSSTGGQGLGGALGLVSSCPNSICKAVSASLYNVSMASNFASQACTSISAPPQLVGARQHASSAATAALCVSRPTHALQDGWRGTVAMLHQVATGRHPEGRLHPLRAWVGLHVPATPAASDSSWAPDRRSEHLWFLTCVRCTGWWSPLLQWLRGQQPAVWVWRPH